MREKIPSNMHFLARSNEKEKGKYPKYGPRSRDKKKGISGLKRGQIATRHIEPCQPAKEHLTSPSTG